MAFPNSAATDIITTTIQSRSRKLQDSVTNNNAFLRELKKENVRPVSGGNVIFEELMYTDSSTINVNSYSGYEVLNIAPNSPLSSPQFNLAQYAGAISMSGLEMLQNSLRMH